MSKAYAGVSFDAVYIRKIHVCIGSKAKESVHSTKSNQKKEFRKKR